MKFPKKNLKYEFLNLGKKNIFLKEEGLSVFDNFF